MHVLRDGKRSIAGGFAARVRIRMARFNPLDGGWKPGVCVRSDGDRPANRQVRDGRERRRHRRRGLPRRHDVQRAAREHVGDLRIGQRARDYTIGADGVDAGADYRIEILLVFRNGNRQ